MPPRFYSWKNSTPYITTRAGICSTSSNIRHKVWNISISSCSTCVPPEIRKYSPPSQHKSEPNARNTSSTTLSQKKYLHVCIKTIDDGPVHNCGRCYKCLRTLAAIDILGKLPEYETIFDQSYYKTHKAAIFAKYLGYRAADPFFADILNFAKQKRGFEYRRWLIC